MAKRPPVLENSVWADLPKDLAPYSTVYWHYKQWRAAGVFEELLSVFHEKVRQQVKKA